jgi:capsular polysaccharide biosynthesis protein
MNTNVQILTTRDFMQSVADKLIETYGEEEYPPDEWTAKAISGRIHISAVEDTKLFNIKVTCDDKEKALQIANVAKDLSIIRLQNIAAANAVTVADPPVLPTSASNNNSGRNTVIGFLIGAALCFVALLLVEMFDVRIKSEEDFVNTYHIPLLGSVPNFERAYKTNKKIGIGKPSTGSSKAGSKPTSAKA